MSTLSPKDREGLMFIYWTAIATLFMGGMIGLIVLVTVGTMASILGAIFGCMVSLPVATIFGGKMSDEPKVP